MYVGTYVPIFLKSFLLSSSVSFKKKNLKLNKFSIRVDAVS